MCEPIHIDGAVEKPTCQPVAKLPRPDDFHQLRADGLVERELADPDVDHRPDVRCDVDVDGKARVGGAEVDTSSMIDDPPAALCFRHTGEVELNCHAPRPED